MSTEFEKKDFNTQLGQKAHVERYDRDATQENTKLREIGRDIHFAKGTPGEEAAEYLGSAAVHIYRTPHLGTMFFVSQDCLGGTPEDIAGAALSDFRKTIMRNYGRKAGLLRSGF